MENIFNIEQLDSFIIENNQSGNVILLYFGAQWCGPCKQLKKRLSDSETINIMPKLMVAYIDVDNKENSDLVNRYKIKSLPTLVLVKLDKNKVIPVSRIDGYDFTKLKIAYDNYFD
jgi:thiol-disulfide isomerase/thioredoxin